MKDPRILPESYWTTRLYHPVIDSDIFVDMVWRVLIDYSRYLIKVRGYYQCLSILPPQSGDSRCARTDSQSQIGV